MAFWIAIIAMCLTVMAFFSGGRKLIAYVFEHVLEGAFQVLATVWKAHLCIARNLLPRMMVLPTLEKRTTKES